MWWLVLGWDQNRGFAASQLFSLPFGVVRGWAYLRVSGASKGRNYAVVHLCARFVGRWLFVSTFDVHDARDFWLGKRLLEKLDG